MQPASDSDVKALEHIIGRFAKQSDGGIALGPYGTLKFECFNDLLSAAHFDADLEVLTSALVSLIDKHCDINTVTVIASPKRGNCLLGRHVARKLQKKSIFVRDDILASRFIEGICEKNENVLLVDCVSSDGDLLYDAIQGLRYEGLHVTRAFTVIDRAEGNAKKRLADNGIVLHSCMELSDADVHAYINAVKTGY